MMQRHLSFRQPKACSTWMRALLKHTLNFCCLLNVPSGKGFITCGDAQSATMRGWISTPLIDLVSSGKKVPFSNLWQSFEFFKDKRVMALPWPPNTKVHEPVLMVYKALKLHTVPSLSDVIISEVAWRSDNGDVNTIQGPSTHRKPRFSFKPINDGLQDL